MNAAPFLNWLRSRSGACLSIRTIYTATTGSAFTSSPPQTSPTTQTVVRMAPTTRCGNQKNSALFSRRLRTNAMCCSASFSDSLSPHTLSLSLSLSAGFTVHTTLSCSDSKLSFLWPPLESFSLFLSLFLPSSNTSFVQKHGFEHFFLSLSQSCLYLKSI